MGLDMYLTGRKVMFTPYAQPPRLEDGYPIEQIEVRLGYWRKHHVLHAFIVDAFAKGIDDCQPIELNADDLQAILESLETAEEGDRGGFTAEDIDSYKATFTKALQWLKQGDPIPDLKPVATVLGTTLQQIGLTVLEFDEYTFPVKDVRYVLYRASW